MNSKTKKIIIIVLLAVIIAIVAGYNYYSNLSCYKKGLCPKDAVVAIEDDKKVIINEVTCRIYNGNWQDITQDCRFKRFKK